MDTSWSHSQFWGTFWGQFTIELIGGIIGAFIFLFIVLIFMKPKVKIADFLCRINPNGGASFYMFKFVNISFFDAHEIKVELYKIRRIPMGGGDFNNEYKQLTLVNGNISQIPGRLFFWQSNKANPHCVTVRSTEDINTILSDDANGISLRVSLKHGLTGLSNVFEQEYGDVQSIKTAKFKPGTKFGTI